MPQVFGSMTVPRFKNLFGSEVEGDEFVPDTLGSVTRMVLKGSVSPNRLGMAVLMAWLVPMCEKGEELLHAAYAAELLANEGVSRGSGRIDYTDYAWKGVHR